VARQSHGSRAVIRVSVPVPYRVRRSHAGSTATATATRPSADSGHQCDIEDERDSAAVDRWYVVFFDFPTTRM